MKALQRVGMIVAMTAVAGGSGYYMQNKHGNGASSQGPVPDIIVPTAATTLAVPESNQITVAPAAMIAPVDISPQPQDSQDVIVMAAAEPLQETAPQANAITPAENCRIDMALIAQPGAMLDIGLLAPCQVNQRVVIRHGGLVVTGLTSAAGTLVASIPALTSPAEVKIDFPGDVAAQETVVVPDLADYDRFGVQWMASDSFQLHAYENGATFGAQGHKSALETGRVSQDGGFVVLLGDDRAERPLLAEVYTYPAKVRATDKDVIVSVEAAVTEASCDREILGETIQLSLGKVTLRDLTIAMPDCTAVGEYMVLDQPVLLASQ